MSTVERMRFPDANTHLCHESDIPNHLSSFYAKAHEASEHLEAAQHELYCDHPNLLAVARLLTECRMEIAHLDKGRPTVSDRGNGSSLEKDVSTLRSAADTLSSRLDEEPCKSLLVEQKKWVEAGFDEQVVVTDPEAVHFAVSSELIYTILMYKNSSDVLEGGQITIPVVNGKALFLKEGKYVPYESIKKIICYSETEKKFIGWNFIHPMGFYPRDNTNFSDMYPIAKIKPDVYRRVAENASHFWSENQDEVDRGVEKNYVLQVMTTGRSVVPRTWWGKHFGEMYPEHSSSRLICPDGSVYSFGTKMRPVDSEEVTKVTNLFTTAISSTSAPDYEEPRKCDEKRVTSIPITKERFDAIVSYANSIHKGFAFNFPNQNCARFVTSQMQLAGVIVDVRMSMKQLFIGILPDLKEVPVIGRTLSSIIAAIAFVAIPIIDSLAAVLRYLTPLPAMKAWEVLTWASRELFRRIGAVLGNSIFYLLLRAGRSIVPPGRITETNTSEQSPVSMPSKLQVMRLRDIFNPDAVVFYHAFKLRQWQNKQRSSAYYEKPSAGFCCIDPAKGSREPMYPV